MKCRQHPEPQVYREKQRDPSDADKGTGLNAGCWTQRLLNTPVLMSHNCLATMVCLAQRWLRAWVHYIPVRESLQDLVEKLRWAEGHLEECQHISSAATALAVTRLNQQAALAYFGYALQVAAAWVSPNTAPCQYHRGCEAIQHVAREMGACYLLNVSACDCAAVGEQ